MVNNASIDWLFPWPDQALLAVATELITADNPLIPGDYRQQIIEHHVDVHKSVIDVSRDFVTTLRRQNYVTPQNFLDFIATYQVPTYLLTYLSTSLLTYLPPPPLSSDRQHLSYDGCLEVRGEIIRTVLCCIVY